MFNNVDEIMHISCNTFSCNFIQEHEGKKKLEIRPRARGTEVHFPELLRSAHRPLT